MTYVTVRRLGRPARQIPAHDALPGNLRKASDALLKDAWQSAVTWGDAAAFDRIRAEISRRAAADPEPSLDRRAAQDFPTARAAFGFGPSIGGVA
ncbi:hypothetical protein [Salipiger bermudensis]|uniref:Uncharacterized protein n=1 Tax=Salipiger bermudensis (strain DSM 26914 / JCM 13377 / KCTC 12554 / HTCC2601) TaxID=314265 RepID=Q0FLI0_SALBH|nr:hypothetical protein [Salipiger bermudensis]EAU45118.1 hypothetical protein R2601_23066 [Salipiger bermudensis HTCC2601]